MSAGGTAYLFGHSSGPCLALESALKLGSKVTGLALYDAPYNDDASRPAGVAGVPPAAHRGPGCWPPR